MKQSLHPYHENPGTIFLLGCLIFFVLSESLQLSGSLFFFFFLVLFFLGSFRDCLDLPIDGVSTTSICLSSFSPLCLPYIESYKYPSCPQVHFTPFSNSLSSKVTLSKLTVLLVAQSQSFHSLSTLSKPIRNTKHSFPRDFSIRIEKPHHQENHPFP